MLQSPDTEQPSEMSEIERIRQENIKLQESLIASLLQSEEFLKTREALEDLKKAQRTGQYTKRSKARRAANKEDETFKFFGYVPSERRRSARLENKDPEFTMYDLPDDEDIRRMKKFYSEIGDVEDLADLEKVVAEPRNPKRLSKKREMAREIIDVEDVTEAMINNICKSVKDKKYSENGTSCHQCRQKTLDQKTCCRNKDCVGVRGQVCGVCAKNRYGESVEEALKDENWHCYVCRGICNCSFCRARAGKRPTGILAPIASKTGYNSVKDLLDSLGGVGDDPSEERIEKPEEVVNKLKYNPEDNLEEEEQALLGFAQKGKAAIIANGESVDLNCICNESDTHLIPDKESFMRSLGVARIKRFAELIDSLENANDKMMEISEELDEVVQYMFRVPPDEDSSPPSDDECHELLGFRYDGSAVCRKIQKEIVYDDDIELLGFSGVGDDTLMHLGDGRNVKMDCVHSPTKNNRYVI